MKLSEKQFFKSWVIETKHFQKNFSLSFCFQNAMTRIRTWVTITATTQCANHYTIKATTEACCLAFSMPENINSNESLFLINEDEWLAGLVVTSFTGAFHLASSTYRRRA